MLHVWTSSLGANVASTRASGARRATAAAGARPGSRHVLPPRGRVVVMARASRVSALTRSPARRARRDDPARDPRRIPPLGAAPRGAARPRVVGLFSSSSASPTEPPSRRGIAPSAPAPAPARFTPSPRRHFAAHRAIAVDDESSAPPTRGPLGPP